MRLRFTDYVFDTEARQLERLGVPVRLSPKAFALLEMLLERRPNAVSKRDLLDRVWPDTIVEERNVKNLVGEIRSALQDDGDDPSIVRTVQRFGYAFSAEVRPEEVRPEPEPARRTRLPARLAVVGGVLVLAIGGIGFWRFSTRKHPTRLVFDQMRVTRVSTAANVSQAAISHDGKLLAYGTETEDGASTLWLGQTGSESRTRLVSLRDVAFGDADYGGITFSPDGNSIYFTTWTPDEVNRLQRIPTIGGPITNVLRDVDSEVTFSPDGTRFAFTRSYPKTQETTLRVANADGSDERVILTKKPFCEFTHASWSPDGRTIATVFNDGRGRFSVECIDVHSGKSETLGTMRWAHAGRLSWLPDGSGLFLIARELGEERADQLWLDSYPEGEARRITRDLNDYRSLTISRDSSLLSVQTAQAGQLWISSATGDSPRQLTLTMQTGLDGLSWTRAGEILYTVTAGTNPDIWRIDPRSNVSVPVIEHAGFDGTPIECGDFVVFTSNRSGKPGVLWRADRDGHNVVRLTEAKTNGWPVCSADGQWVFYSAPEDDRTWDWLRVWRVSIRGAAPQLVSHAVAYSAVVLSPDGKRLAFVSQPLAPDDAPLGKAFLAILDIDRGTMTKLENPLGMVVGLPLQWTPDGQAVAYVAVRDGVSNLWRMPIDGTAATPITHFDSGEALLHFAFSGDGKQLAMVRGWKNTDVVLMSPAPQ
jgi:eukaryotic-like serine/threonine-protein kinase